MKRAIPTPALSNQTRFNEVVKENLEVLSGLRGGKIKELPSTASAADVIAKVNEILKRMQG